MRKLGDGSAFINEPSDDAANMRRKEELEKQLDPRKHQYLSMIFGGQRIEVPLSDFIEKHGNPMDYDQASLKRYILKTWMSKNL